MRFGVREDGRVEEAGVEEGPFVAGGVGPGEVSRGQTFESFGLVVAGQFAGPDVVGCGYRGGILGEGGEYEAIASSRVPDIPFVSLEGKFDEIGAVKAGETLRSCKVVRENGTKGMANVDDL